MGVLKAVILDWAGTTVDAGSRAPLVTIQTVLSRHQIPVTEAQARRDMGLPKREHIRRLLAVVEPGATEERVDQLYAEFIPLQMEVLAAHSAVIPGVVEAVERMRKRGLKIGSTTGYTRAMLDLLADLAQQQGYSPDCSLTPEDAGAGRPHPFMIYQSAIRMQVYPLSAFVKVGDTPADIDEGRNAGAWTVGVYGTGNSSKDELEVAAPHFLIENVSVLDPILDEIDARLTRGWGPYDERR
jgi:phosphonoacetaldehyde hydrolase